MAACDGCGLTFSDEEISAYLDRALCRKCYPKTPSLKALRETSEQSPFMAFALSMLFPGGGHVYAGAVRLGYVLNAVVNGVVVVVCVGALLVSPIWFLAAMLGVALLLPLGAIAIGGHAARVSQAVRRGERPQPGSLRPLWIFMTVGAASLGVVGLVLVACLLHVFMNAGRILGG